MRKIFVSGASFYSCLFFSVFFSILAVWATVLECQNPDALDVKAFFELLFLYAFDAAFILSLNWVGSVVILEDGVIKCKGLFLGFYKECEVRSIRKVKTKHHWRDGTYLYLIDREATNADLRWLRSGSCIGFRKTKRNLAFLRQFWHGKIQ